MNSIRYKKEYSEQVIKLLKDTPNSVNLSSDIFMEIGGLFEGEPDGERLDKLLKKTYTVMAIDKGELVGLASMDKDGCIGIFAVCGNARVKKHLLGALDRRAEKTALPQLLVQPFDNVRDLFLSDGYMPMNEDDDFILIKQTAPKGADLPPEKSKTIVLDPKKSIVVEGKRSVFPFFFFGICCFFAIILIVLSVTEYKNAFAEKDTAYITIFVIVTVLFVSALAVFIGYFVRQATLKKQVLSMRITNGVITSFSTVITRDPDDMHFDKPTKQAEYTRVYITYVYYDENMVKREGYFTHKYSFSGPYFYKGQELVIACAGEKSYILNKYTSVNENGGCEETEEETSDLLDDASINDLSAYVPIKAAKIYYGYAFGFLIAFAIVLAVFLVFGIIVANYTGRPWYEEILENLLFSSPFYVILGGFGIYTISIPLIAKRKYKKLLACSDVKCAKGKIVHADKTYKSDNKMRFYCNFFDGKKKRQVAVPYRSASNLVKSGKTAVLVVYNATDAIVLIKRGKYPDVFSFVYYRN